MKQLLKRFFYKELLLHILSKEKSMLCYGALDANAGLTFNRQ